MKRVLSYFVMVALVFLLAVPLTVSAAELPDWDTVDWESQEWWDWLEDEIMWSALEDWLRTGAELDQVFLICTKGDGAMREMLSEVTCVRFLESPDDFLIALTNESEEIQNRIIVSIIYGMYGYTVRGRLLLSQYKQNPVVPGGTEKTNQLLMALLDEAEKSMGNDFTSPDPDYVDVDWDNMDWKAFDWNKLDQKFYKTWLYEWFHNEGGIVEKFQLARNNQHPEQGAEYRESFARSFRWEATEVILEISKLSQEERDAFVDLLVENMPAYFDKDDIRMAFNRLSLPADASPDARNLAEKAAEAMEEKYDMTIILPKTGDPVMAVVAGMLLSGGGILLLRKKKIR